MLRYIRLLRKRHWAWSFLLIWIMGCASGPQVQGLADYDQESQAAPEAYRSDAMHIRSPMPYRPDWHPWQFYYKHCTELGEDTFYSKTSYGCSDPY